MKAQLVDVHFGYAADKPILRGIDLALETGQCLGLMGPSGAGKSTLARHLNGLLRPSKGAVLLDGRDVRSEPVAVLSRQVGYVFQNPLHQLFAQTIREEVSLALTGGPARDHEEAKRRIDEMLAAFGLEDMASRHPLSVSEGQRKRIALAAVLVAQPRFVILDEPTLGQDGNEKRRLAALLADLRRRDTGVLLITHDVEFAVDCCTHLAILQDGRLRAEGPVEQVAFDEASFVATGSMPPQIASMAALLGWGRVLSVDQAFRQLVGG